MHESNCRKVRSRFRLCHMVALALEVLFSTAFVVTVEMYPSKAATLSPLTARGYTVLPIPQKVVVGQEEFEISDGWQLVTEGGVAPDDIAVDSLKRDLNDRFHLNLSEGR